MIEITRDICHIGRALKVLEAPTKALTTTDHGEIEMATKFKACAIEGCKRNAHRDAHGTRGWCQSHSRRWRAYGDPLAGRTPQGEPLRYLEETVLTYEGDECLIWPYWLSKGYGALNIDGRAVWVSRVVCDRVQGAPPTPAHQAAHSCGRGDSGCVTKRHLSWKTPKENEADKLLHGTRLRGESHCLAKLSEETVREIRSLRGKLTSIQLSERFGMSTGQISNVMTRKHWAWVE